MTTLSGRPKTALIVIDVQESFRVRPNWQLVNHPDIAERVDRLVRAARDNGDLVVWVLHTEPGTEEALIAYLESMKFFYRVEVADRTGEFAVVHLPAGSITVISCYMGFNTQQGAEGVGRSTTTAVVTSSVLILVLDTVLTRLLLNQ